MLMNNDHVRQLAASFAARVEATYKAGKPGNLPGVVDTVYQLALSRLPGDEERQLGVDTLIELRESWPENPKAALETYCHTILNSGAFLYID